VEKLSSGEFEPEAYSDEYRARVKAMLDQKAKGREITVAPPAPPRGHVVDIYAALKKSLESAKPRAKADARKRRKA
jgi:DNA end-binding protein Ku